MTFALKPGEDGKADPRILKVQVERAAKAIHGTVIGSPLWVCFFAFMCSEAVPFLGKVPAVRAVALVVIVFLAAALAQCVLHAYHRSQDGGAHP